MKLLMVIITSAVSFVSSNQKEKSKVSCSLYMATHDDSLTDYIKIFEKDGKVQGGFYYGEGLQVDGKKFYYFTELSFFEGSQQEISLESVKMEFGRWPGKNSTVSNENDKVDAGKLPWYYEKTIYYLGVREDNFLRLTIASQKYLFGMTEVMNFRKLAVQCIEKPELDL